LRGWIFLNHENLPIRSTQVMGKMMGAATSAAKTVATSTQLADIPSAR
jgi:hypothetical protein